MPTNQMALTMISDYAPDFECLIGWHSKSGAESRIIVNVI
jgi:hypothetical protein